MARRMGAISELDGFVVSRTAESRAASVTTRWLMRVVWRRADRALLGMPGSTTGGGAITIGVWLGVTIGGTGWTTACAGCALSVVMSATSPAPSAKPARPPTPRKTTAREALTPAMSRVPHPGQRRFPVSSGLEQAGHATMFASDSPMGRDGAMGVPRPRRPIRPTFWLPISSVMGVPRDLAAGRSPEDESGPVVMDSQPDEGPVVEGYRVGPVVPAGHFVLILSIITAWTR